MEPEYIALGMFVGLLIGLFLGHPLAFVLGGLAVIFGYLGWGPDAFSLFINRTYGIILLNLFCYLFSNQLLYFYQGLAGS